MVVLDNQNTKNEVTKICNEPGISHKVAECWIVIVKILFQIESRNFDRFWEKWFD